MQTATSSGTYSSIRQMISASWYGVRQSVEALDKGASCSNSLINSFQLVLQLEVFERCVCVGGDTEIVYLVI